MNIEELRAYVMSKPGVEETVPFGPDTLVYKINGKMFFATGLDRNPVTFNVKCDPEKAIQLREKFPAVTPGYHMNKIHWNTVTIDGSIPKKLLKEFIDDSYDLVLKRK